MKRYRPRKTNVDALVQEVSQMIRNGMSTSEACKTMNYNESAYRLAARRRGISINELRHTSKKVGRPRKYKTTDRESEVEHMTLHIPESKPNIKLIESCFEIILSEIRKIQ